MHYIEQKLKSTHSMCHSIKSGSLGACSLRKNSKKIENESGCIIYAINVGVL